MARILVVEDEAHLAEGLRFNLEAEGHEVAVAETGDQGFEAASADPPFDLVVLDVMLPGMSGFDVADCLRRDGRFMPILMLTARGRAEDILRGFEVGADDYLAKPFELAILMARVRSLLRRGQWQTGPAKAANVFDFGSKRIDFDRLLLIADGREIKLTLMEANLLRFLIRHEGKVVARKAMLDEVWEVREDTDTRAIDNFIARVRKLIEDEPSQPRHLLTVRGVGYRFVANP